MMQARIRTARWECEGVLSFMLEPLPGRVLPGFDAGAHIDVEIAPGLARSYSLLNAPAPGRADRYEIAVQLEPGGRGGSARIHADWRPGQIVAVGAPANHFPLDPQAPHSVFIAGGIGVTPMLSMIASLHEQARSWELHCAVSRPERAALLARLPASGRAVLYVHDGGGPRLDIAAVLRQAREGAHFYCCGPERMIEAFKHLAEGRDPASIHYEYFAAAVDAATGGGYTLRLRRSGRRIDVEPGQTMLDALLDAGVDIGFACSEGVCGSCRVAVVDGVPDHRDRFLSDAEKACNQSVMVCCSGSRSGTLVLDL